MDLLKKYGILFGTSVCYTKNNVEAVTTDEFFKMLSDKGAKFGFYFHYMPVGNDSPKDLLPTPEQRKYMIKRIREVRDPNNEKYKDLTYFPMDFQNDGEFVGGCIASLVEETTSISIQQVMQNHVYLFIIQMPIFMIHQYLKF